MEGVEGLKVAMVGRIQTTNDERKLLKYTKAPCDSIMQLYQAKETLIDDEVNLVKIKYTMNKTLRRQMASTSPRNLISHICTIVYSNFFLVLQDSMDTTTFPKVLKNSWILFRWGQAHFYNQSAQYSY